MFTSTTTTSRTRFSKRQPSSSPHHQRGNHPNAESIGRTNTLEPKLKKPSHATRVPLLSSRCRSLPQAMTLAASGDQVAQEAAAECFCSAASFDGGRALLGPVVESGVIFALMESKSQAARSAAARRGVHLFSRILNGV